VLAEASEAYNRAVMWAHIYDHEWRLVYMTDELCRSSGNLEEMGPVPLGAHLLGPEYINEVLSSSAAPVAGVSQALGTSAVLVPVSTYIQLHPSASNPPDLALPPRSKPSGGAKRVPALQAGGRRFETGWLHWAARHDEPAQAGAGSSVTGSSWPADSGLSSARVQESICSWSTFIG
jgi:hypothetical protein